MAEHESEDLKMVPGLSEVRWFTFSEFLQMGYPLNKVLPLVGTLVISVLLNQVVQTLIK